MTEIDRIMPVASVKRDFLEILKTMEEDDSTIAVTRNGEPVGVMMTPRRYDALLETIEISSDKHVMESLAESRDDFEKGRIHGDDEVWD